MTFSTQKCFFSTYYNLRRKALTSIIIKSELKYINKCIRVLKVNLIFIKRILFGVFVWVPFNSVIVYRI
jgi:hypothetical protein